MSNGMKKVKKYASRLWSGWCMLAIVGFVAWAVVMALVLLAWGIIFFTGGMVELSFLAAMDTAIKAAVIAMFCVGSLAVAACFNAACFQRYVDGLLGVGGE